jgi:hypothetical protein
MARPSHSSRFYHPNNIWRGVQIIKLLIMYLLVTTHMFISILKWVIRIRILCWFLFVSSRSIPPSSTALWKQHVVLYKQYLTKESRPNRKLYFSSC